MATMQETALENLTQQDAFIHRHIGPSPNDIAQMLGIIGVSSLDELIETTVPASILLDRPLDLPPASPEHAALARLRQYADKNKIYKSYIGMGYYNTLVPNVIAKRTSEPWLVHGLYSLSSGNIAGTTGSTFEFSADGHGFDRNGNGKRIAAG